MHLLDFIFFRGRIIDIGENVDPNKLFPWMTWKRYGNGRVTVGVDENDPDFDEAGKTGGEKAHKNTIEEMPMHHHQSERAPIRYAEAASGSAVFYNDGRLGNSQYPNTTSVGGNEAHNNLQPYITVYKWIRVK